MADRIKELEEEVVNLQCAVADLQQESGTFEPEEDPEITKKKAEVEIKDSESDLQAKQALVAALIQTGQKLDVVADLLVEDFKARKAAEQAHYGEIAEAHAKAEIAKAELVAEKSKSATDKLRREALMGYKEAKGKKDQAA